MKKFKSLDSARAEIRALVIKVNEPRVNFLLTNAKEKFESIIEEAAQLSIESLINFSEFFVDDLDADEEVEGKEDSLEFFIQHIVSKMKLETDKIWIERMDKKTATALIYGMQMAEECRLEIYGNRMMNWWELLKEWEMAHKERLDIQRYEF